MLKHGIRIAVSGLVLLIFTVSLVISTPTSALAGQGLIILYEGNDGRQDVVEDYPDATFEGKVSPDDEARSLELVDVKGGAVITVYDSPSRSADDDYTVIQVKKPIPLGERYTVNTFEKTYEDDFVKQTYTEHNGLDGKVSYISIVGGSIEEEE